MAYRHRVNQSVEGLAGTIPLNPTAVQYEASQPFGVDETWDEGTHEANVAIDVSAVKSVIIYANKDCDLTTFNGEVEGETINLLAGIPYLWNIQSYDPFLLTSDVTKVSVVVGEDGTRLQIDGVQDATP
jgi:hypothetical protein